MHIMLRSHIFCLVCTLISSCSSISTSLEILSLKEGERMELQNGNWVLIKPEPPKPPSPFELEVQKELVHDVLVGHACNNKYSFEIKITGTEGDLNKETYALAGTLTVSSQTHQQFKTELRSSLHSMQAGYGSVTFYAAYSGGRQPTLGEAETSILYALRMDLARDANGKGWEGTIEGDNFPACVDLTLISTQGRNTSIFPGPNYPYYPSGKGGYNEYEYDAAWRKPPKYGVVPTRTPISSVIQVYWTKKFFDWTKKSAALHNEQNYATGRIYEKLGKTLPESYPLALQVYLVAAKRLDDVRVYYALSRMYAAGLGTNVDVSESKKWLDQAQAAYLPANDVCISSEVLKMFELQWNEIEQRNQVMNVFGNLFLGTDNDIGQIVIGRIEADELINLQQPFVCKAAIQRIDASFDLGEPDYYIATGPSGETYYYDNSLAKVSSDLLSSFSNALSRRPYSDRIKIYPAKDGQFVMEERLNGKTEHIIFTPHHSGIKK